MKYFIDTEFSERAGERPTIDLISIGIVCEDSRTYYAESSEFNEELCNPWVKANVLPKLGDASLRETREDIRDQIIQFIEAPLLGDRGRTKIEPEFWAYYADYDWVAFCWLFGAMVDLPKGYPMLCMDLQQWWIQMGKPDVKPTDPMGEHDALVDALWNQRLYHKLCAEQRRRERKKFKARAFQTGGPTGENSVLLELASHEELLRFREKTKDSTLDVFIDVEERGE